MVGTLGAQALISTYGLTYAGNAATATTAAVGGGPVSMAMGLGLLVVGGLIDQRVMGRLFGKKGSDMAEPSRLLEMPTGSYGQGEPSIWAIGRCVRVPVHPLWQSVKRRENRNASKAGTGVAQTRVTIDCALALNERLTGQLVQLIAQGKLILFTTRNVILIRTHEITVSQSGGRLVLTMQNTRVPDWTHRFAAGHISKLNGFVPAVGTPNLNGSYWKVQAVTAHSSASPSVLTLDPYQGQSLAGLNSTAGVPQSPAEVVRVIDAIVEHAWTVQVFTAMIGSGVPQVNLIRLSGVTTKPKPNEVFRPGDHVKLSNFGGTGGTMINGARDVHVTLVDESTIILEIVRARHPVTNAGIVIPAGSTFTCGTANNAASIEFEDPTSASLGLFPSTFVPAAHFYPGSDTQGEDSIITDAVGIGKVGGFRGRCLQVLQGFDVTSFGGGMPAQFESLVAPDPSLDWAGAFLLVCERCGLDPQFVDVAGVTPHPFEGMFLRGSVPGVTILQDMLMVAQVATQERDGVLCFSDIDNLDQVPIENSARINELGGYVGAPSQADDEIEWEEMIPEDIPTRVAVRHQDPDNYWLDGYQPFGGRHPSAPTYQNNQEITVPNIVLTRKQARELAATAKRRAHINARQGKLTLTALHLDVLENDLLPVRDRHGNDYLLRTIRRDEGANWLVEISGAQEEIDLAVRGAPVQSSAGYAPQPFVQLADVVGVVLDMPPLRDQEGRTPQLVLAAAPLGAGAWAGVTVYVSTDGGQNFSQVGTLSQASCIGRTLEDLPAGTRCEQHGTTTLVWDTTTTLDVEFEFDQVAIPPQTLTEAEVIGGFNWFAVLDPSGVLEIIGVRDVTQTGTRAYTFSYMLRGLRGTKPAAKLTGCRIVQVSLLSQLTGLVVPGTVGTNTLQFRFVTPGRDLASTTSVGITSEWRNCLPFPVRDLTKAIGASPYAARFSFDHWTRQNLPLGSLGPYPLDETDERYVVEIYNPQGTAITRRFNLNPDIGSNTIRDKWVDYPAADQITDGYTPGPTETFWVDVRQVGNNGTGPSVLQEL